MSKLCCKGSDVNRKGENYGNSKRNAIKGN